MIGEKSCQILPNLIVTNFDKKQLINGLQAKESCLER